MRPQPWQPPVALSPQEAPIIRRIQRAKLFLFLRQQRHVLFSDAFQGELATTPYADKPKGRPPVPPAQLAMAILVQASTGASDDEVIEATTMDRRWQVVLDCLDAAAPPFSKATLVAFRQRLIAHEGDRRLIERTLEVAQESGAFSPRALRAALDSSPRWGAGRVEDTDNLVGHAAWQGPARDRPSAGAGAGGGGGRSGGGGGRRSAEPESGAGPGLGRPSRTRPRAGGGAGRARGRGAVAGRDGWGGGPARGRRPGRAGEPGRCRAGAGAGWGGRGDGRPGRAAPRHPARSAALLPLPLPLPLPRALALATRASRAGPLRGGSRCPAAAPGGRRRGGGGGGGGGAG